VLPLVDAAIIAVDAADTEVAKARLQVLAEAREAALEWMSSVPTGRLGRAIAT
jgi:hypothetical protein